MSFYTDYKPYAFQFKIEFALVGSKICIWHINMYSYENSLSYVISKKCIITNICANYYTSYTRKKKKHGNLVGSPLQILPLSHDFISVFLSTSIIHEVQDLASCRGVGAASRGINQRLDPPMEGVWLWCLGGFFWDLEHHQFWNLLILSVSWILYHLWKSLWYIFGGASSKPVERCLFSRNMDVFLNIGPFHIK